MKQCLLTHSRLDRQFQVSMVRHIPVIHWSSLICREYHRLHFWVLSYLFHAYMICLIVPPSKHSVCFYQRLHSYWQLWTSVWDAGSTEDESWENVSCFQCSYYSTARSLYLHRKDLRHWGRILGQVTIYRRLPIGRDYHLDQSEAYDIS